MRRQGFTLVELLIVTAIIGVTGVAFVASDPRPSLEHYNRALFQEYLDAHRFAQSEAIRTQAVHLVFSKHVPVGSNDIRWDIMVLRWDPEKGSPPDYPRSDSWAWVEGLAAVQEEHGIEVVENNPGLSVVRDPTGRIYWRQICCPWQALPLNIYPAINGQRIYKFVGFGADGVPIHPFDQPETPILLGWTLLAAASGYGDFVVLDDVVGTIRVGL